MDNSQWSRETWDKCVSSKAYNPDWWMTLTPETEPQLWDELKFIYEDEKAVGDIPEWASGIVMRMMELPMCGYYGYPANVKQILDAISTEQCPDVVMRCYTVDPDRKTLLSYYVFCLDAWLKDADLSLVASELSLRDQLGKNWDAISSAIYETLGDKTDFKQIAVERLIHRLRWWIKSLIWIDDKRDRFLLDVYSGDIRGNEAEWGSYGNPSYGDPYFAELDLPNVKAMGEYISSNLPDGQRLLDRIHSTWLCAPKAFRYLEKIIIEIGAIGKESPDDGMPVILQCEDTYPNLEAYRDHFVDLLDRFQRWLDGDADCLPSLGQMKSVNRWLVHLLRHQLVFQSTYEDNFAKLLGGKPHGLSGSKRPDQII